jgi:hypothetical protein
MVSFDEASALLDEAASELPREIYAMLNGGISFTPDTKKNTIDPEGNLYILGEYQVNSLGRTIVLFYGSFLAVYGETTADRLKVLLGNTLKHELTHHWESLAGEKDLEIDDAIKIRNYFARTKKQGQ